MVSSFMSLKFVKSFLFRAISFLLICFLLIEQEGMVGYAASLDFVSASPDTRISPPLFSELPADLGKIRHFYRGKGNELVIHIQDLHMNQEAQLKMSEIIQQVARKIPVQLLALEGASGELSHRPLSTFPHEPSRRSVADYLLTQGAIGGAEYLAITRRPELTLYGVEDETLYRKNREAYFEAQKLQEKNRSFFNELRSRFDSLARLVFSSELMQFWGERKKFEEGKLEILPYAEYLDQIYRKYHLKEKRDQISLLLKLQHRQQGLTEGAQVSLDLGLFDEIRSIQSALENVLAQNEDEKTLLYYLRVVEVMGHLMTLSLTREDTAFLSQSRRDLTADSISRFLESLRKKYRLGWTLSYPLLQRLESDCVRMQSFYDYALERDHSLVTNTLSAMRQNHQKTAVLVTGGFHSAAIEEELKRQKISHVIIAPALQEKMDQIREKAAYEKAMSGDIAGLSEFLDVKFQLLPPRRLPHQTALANLPEGPWNLQTILANARVLDFVFDARLLLEVTAQRLGAVQSEKPHFDLTPQEKALIDLAHDLVSKENMQRIGTADNGELLTSFSKVHAAAVYAKWSSGVAPEIRILRDPQVYDQTKKELLRRSELRNKNHVRFPSIKFEMVPEERKTGEPERLERLFANHPEMTEQILKTFEENSFSIPEDGIDFNINAFSVLKDGLRVPKPGRGQEEIKRVYQLIATTDQGSIQYTLVSSYNEEGEKTWSFQPYSVIPIKKVVFPLLEDEDISFEPETPNFLEMDDGEFMDWVQDHESNLEEWTSTNPVILKRLAEISSITRKGRPRTTDMPDEEFLKWLEENPEAAAEDPDILRRLSKLSAQKGEEEVVDSIPTLEIQPIVAEEEKLQKGSWFASALVLDIPLLISAMHIMGIGGPAILAGLAASFFVRAGFMALLLHEWFHLIASVMTGRKSLTLQNLAGNRLFSEWLQSLNPFQPMVLDTQIKVEEESRSAFVRYSGWLGSFFYAVFLAGSIYLIPFTAIFLLPLIPGAFFVALKSFYSDVLNSESEEGVYCCGNQGVLAKRRQGESAILPNRLQKIMAAMGTVTKVRGEQAAGRVVMTKKSAKRKRFVNWKRFDLAAVLEKGSRRQMNFSRLFGENAAKKTYLVMEHYRYGTASAPAVKETHPHQWMPERKVSVWKIKEGKPVKENRRLINFITHNGDFDYWHIFGEDIPFDVLGLWLQRVLHTKNYTNGDSPKIAGMIDLLVTQGMWDASVRLAYQLAVASSIEDAAPSRQSIARWAGYFEKAWINVVASKGGLSQTKLNDIGEDVRQKLKREIFRQIQGDQDIQKWETKAARKFVRYTVDAFLDHDVYHSVQKFMQRAKGSFGLAVASSLNSEAIVLSAKGQPISIGFHPEEGFVTYASEFAALKVPLDKEGKNRIPYRLDLDQIHGEIAELTPESMRLYSEALKREITAEELAYSGRMIDMIDNPLVDSLPKKSSGDVVGADIYDIPKTLFDIRKQWKKSSSFNRQTTDELLNLLARKAGNLEERGEAKEADILITGIEISQWLSEQFTNDLEKLFPDLKIRSISANKIVKSAGKGKIPYVGPKTIVLAISQSGQTFPTLNATIALQKIIPGRVFVMTGEMDSLMGAAVGQYYYKGARFNRRILTNGSGRRPAEPSSVASAASHHTLTEFLLYLAEKMPSVTEQDHPFGAKYTSQDIKELRRLRDLTIDQAMVSITGATVRGEKVKSVENQKLLKNGRLWGQHILEPAWDWGLRFLYVGFLVFSGINLFAIWNYVPIPFETPWMDKILMFNKALDVVLLVFLSFVVSLVIRFFQGRSLLPRLGKRTLVIGEATYVHSLLEAFVSKLFSMSYGIASIDVHGANPDDHMLHRFGHRIVRGTLVLLGRPDGRLESLRDAESNVLMTAKQAKGVRNFGMGAEVVAIGHNPKENPNAMDRSITLWSPEMKVSPLVEELYESRFASFQRLVAGFVLFHGMAKKVSSFWPLHYDMSRSQSGTRIATTAAPASGATIAGLMSNGKKVPQEEVIKKVLKRPAPLPISIMASDARDISAETKMSDTAIVNQGIPHRTYQLNEPEKILLKILGAQIRSKISQLAAEANGDGLDISRVLPLVRNFIFDTIESLDDLNPQTKDKLKSEVEEIIQSQVGQMTEQNSRSELREIKPELIKAIDEKSRIEEEIRLTQEIDFVKYALQAKQAGFDLNDALLNSYRFISEKMAPSFELPESGEVILNISPLLIDEGFVRRFLRDVGKNQGIKQVHFIPDPSLSRASWERFKWLIEKTKGLSLDAKLIFADDEKISSLSQLVADRAKETGANPEFFVQVLLPVKFRKADMSYIEASLLGGVPLGQNTVVILGSSQPLPQIRKWDLLDLVIQSFEVHREITRSA